MAAEDAGLGGHVEQDHVRGLVVERQPGVGLANSQRKRAEAGAGERVARRDMRRRSLARIVRSPIDICSVAEVALSNPSRTTEYPQYGTRSTASRTAAARAAGHRRSTRRPEPRRSAASSRRPRACRQTHDQAYRRGEPGRAGEGSRTDLRAQARQRGRSRPDRRPRIRPAAEREESSRPNTSRPPRMFGWSVRP